MTFETFVLNTRRRLQDLRLSNNQIITSGSQNGKRYSATQLIEICNQALLTYSRLTKLYPASPLAKQLGEDLIAVPSTLAFTTGLTNKALPANCVGVLGVNAGDEYEYISPMEYLLYKTGTNNIIADSYFYTVMREATALAKGLYILPVPTGALTVNYVYLGRPLTLTSSEFSSELIYTDSDDVLLDLAEYEARKREGASNEAALCLESVKVRLGLGGSRNA